MLEEIKNIFTTKIIPKTNYLLDNYISFCLKNQEESDIGLYTERHHILPVSLFPQYKNNKVFIVRLLGRNHFLAHYHLFEAFPNNPKIVFAFNMMKRVLNNEIDKEILPDAYEKYRIILSETISKTNSGRVMTPEQKIEISNRYKGTAIYTLCGSNIRLPTDHNSVLSGLAVSVNNGKRHSEETKLLMSSNGIKGKNRVFNTITGKFEYTSLLYDHHQKIKDQKLISLFKNLGKMKFIYNPNTDEQYRIDTNTNLPEGFVFKRNNFGENGNPFIYPIFFNLITKENRVFKDNNIPPFFINKQNKYFYFCEYNGIKYFSASVKRLSSLFNMKERSFKTACRNNNIKITKKVNEEYLKPFIGKTYREIGFFSIEIANPFVHNALFDEYQWI